MSPKILIKAAMAMVEGEVSTPEEVIRALCFALVIVAHNADFPLYVVWCMLDKSREDLNNQLKKGI
jgi:hypothetical protein